MTKKQINNIDYLQAIESLKYNIKFMEDLMKNIYGEDKDQIIKAIYAANCIHRYINDQLINDVQLMDLAYSL